MVAICLQKDEIAVGTGDTVAGDAVGGFILFEPPPVAFVVEFLELVSFGEDVGELSLRLVEGIEPGSVALGPEGAGRESEVYELEVFLVKDFL